MTGRPISILLIEDEHDFVVAFEAILGEIKSEQYDLERVDTFELARKMIAARRHDVYVVDYVLGDGDGLELIREATSSGHPGPFIVLTARGNREVDQRAMDAGAADYLDKTVVGKFAFAEGGDVNPGADLLERSIRYSLARASTRAELKASETQFRSLIEGSIQGINVVKDGVTVFANQAMADIFGYAGTQDIVGTQINDRIAPEEHERLLAFREARLRGEDTPAQYEFQGIRKDGKYIWLQVFAHLITWEDEPAILVTLIDITARKQAEEALRESQERFYQMAENIPATVFEFIRSADGSYRAPYINRIGVDYMGLTSDELETLTDSAAPIFERMHPDDQDSFLKALGNSHQSMTRFDWQGRGKHASGDWHWLHGFASPRKLENGEVMWNGVILDIHKQRQDQEALRQSEARLRTVIEGSIQGINVLKDSVTVFANQAMADIFGYAGTQEIIGTQFTERIAPEERERILAIREARLRGEDAPNQYDYRGIRKDGTYIWLQVFVNTITWEDEPATLVTLIDITARNRAEKALRDSEQRYRELIEYSLQGVSVNRDGKFLFCSQAMARMFGIDDPQTMVDRDVESFYTAESNARRIERRANVLKDGTLVPAQLEALRPDGTRFWVESFTRIVDWQGAPAYISVHVDITERKRAEEALRQSEERYRRLIGHSLQGMVVVKENEVLFANRAEAEMFGFDDPEQMIGTPINNLIAPEDLERLTGYRMARLRGEPAVTRYEFRGLRVDGSPVWIEALVDAIPWGDETVIQAVHIDITERKRAEEALKKSESHLASILDTAGDGIVTMDDACIVQSFNKAAEHIFGYSALDVIGRNVNVLMPPEIADIHNGFIDRYLQTGETAIIGVGRELTGRRKDGSTFPLFLNVSEVRDGDRVTFTGILRDISELKRAEQQLIEANQAKSRFLSHMSHELRNPLSAILGFTQLLKRDPTLGEEHLNDMRIIHSSAEHLLELINDVLDISKIEAGMETVQEEEFDLYLNLEGLMDMFSVRATVKGLTLEMDVHADVPKFVRGDRRKMRQVLINLIGNAIKFTDQGGVRLEVSRGVEGIRFKVKDTGTGISNEDLNHIFEPFHQADRTAAAGGTGLGLPISKNFVELMGGQLTVDSRENEGSVFAFSLPLKALGEETVPRPDDHKTITGLADHRDWRILIVDDERVNRKFLKNLLERTGFTTQEAVNGSEAINQFEEFSPHLILMDVRMPIMDGMEAARRIREMENEGRIAIIALTANAFVRDEREFIRAGCDSVISKPFDAGNLLLSVGKLLQIEFTYDESPADNLAG